MNVAIPANEAERLRALQRYEILDSAAEQCFDDIALLASHICEAPIATISFVDSGRQWFKSRVGLDFQETPRDIAFCAHGILEPEFFEVADTLTDERFATNPLVKGGGRVRFYAGTPLVTSDGHALGMLCVNDSTPRHLSAPQRAALQALGRQVVAQLELRLSTMEARRNLAELRQIQAVEHAQRTELQVLFDQVPAMIWLQDMRGGVLRLNQRAADLAGKSVAELEDRSVTLNFPEQIAGLLADHHKVGATGTAELGLVRVIVGADGVERWLKVDKIPLYDTDGKITRILVMAQDVTEEQRATAMMAELAAIVESTSDAVMGFNPEGIITAWNHGATETFGYSASEMIGQTIGRLASAPDQAAETEIFRRTGHGELLRHYDRVWRHKDGHHIDVSVTTSVIKNAQGKIVGTSKVCRDITTRKRAAAELLEAKKAAEAANQAKSEFLAIMSHEIRTPMNGLIGFADLLLGTDLSADQLHFAQTVRLSGQNLLRLINDILDFSKIEAGKLDLECVAFDLPEVIGEVVELLANQAKQKQIAFAAHCDPDVPRELRGDPGRVRQVLLNLAGNALKFTEQGTVTLRVQRDKTEAAEIRFLVNDTGIGIPEAKQARLFQAFTQADSSTTRRFGGTGLGLAISKRLVELMGGQIGLISQAGEGSTFWFTLPRSAAPTSGSPKPPTRPAPTVFNPPDVPVHIPAGLRILLVEDDPVNQRLGLHLLEKIRCDVEVAGNGIEGVAKAEQRPFDLIFMDVLMPEMDGLTATWRIRLSEGGRRHVPIIATTASTQEGQRERCLAAGMDDFLEKPIHAGGLEEMVRKWAGRNGALAAANIPAA